MSALDVASRAEADTAECMLFHVVVVGLVCLNIGTEWKDGMFGGVDVLASEEVTQRILWVTPALVGRAFSQNTALLTRWMRTIRGRRRKGSMR